MAQYTKMTSLILSGNLSSSQVSNTIHLERNYGYSVTVYYSGSSAITASVGTVRLEVSNTAPLDGNNQRTNVLQEIWAPISTTLDISGSNTTGSITWNVSDSFYSAARVNYSVTAGSGTIVAYCSKKG